MGLSGRRRERRRILYVLCFFQVLITVTYDTGLPTSYNRATEPPRRNHLLVKGDPTAELKSLMSSEPDPVAFGAPWLYVHGEPVWWKTLKIEIPREGKGTGQEWTLG